MLNKALILEIAAFDKNECWLAQIRTRPSTKPFKNQSDRCTSKVFKANFNTVGSQQFTNKFLEALLTEVKSLFPKSSLPKPQNNDSIAEKLAERIKKVASKLVVNPTSATFIAATKVSSDLTGDPLFNKEDLSANAHGDLTKVASAAYKDIKSVVQPDNACLSDEATKEAITERLLDEPIDLLREFLLGANATSIATGSVLIGGLTTKAIQVAAVVLNTLATNLAAQEFFIEAQQAYGFNSSDKDLETIKQIVDDTRYLRTIFVRNWKPKEGFSASNSSKERSLYREAAIYELMCVLGKDATIRRLSKDYKNHLPDSLVKRLEQCLLIAIYGNQAHTLPNQKDLLKRLRNACNNMWENDQVRAMEIDKELKSNCVRFACDNIKRKAMYEQLYSVRDFVEKSQTRAASQAPQGVQSDDDSTNQPAM